MGVWARRPVGTHITRQHDGLQTGYRRILADFSQEDVVGSPYCVHRYVVDKHLGGPEGLAARFEMSDPGLYGELEAWGFHFLRIEEEDHV